ncbi:MULTISPECIES: cysteine--tRNA ligase [Methanosphaera]|uniref:Cysteine--tRNA ligase n=1 Tax=Methanosphaera stadtmanae (strain ATCC 43021 / DSM 3091 / JCM 11832 / MCB-3) TaxID=339860 RepID=Q2NHU1_METST|nr:CysS [Methanosphaera stadtmanae DSM 3091]OEC90512.1 cysteine--tRNA ligase [Methanosphaera sp. A6]RAP48728.1 MAG: cysteine--tRNA ligase [Methanosphaera sp. DEW79]
MIKVYSTMTRQKEELKVTNNKIKLFVCGPTVYDYSHIGHARTYISFDVIVRYLKHEGYSVFYLQNITDIDDKIIKRAKENNEDPLELSHRFEKEYLKDMETLNVSNVNFYARATEHMNEIINQIQDLIDKGYAYDTETGVYFDVSKFEDFGKLSNRNLDDLQNTRIQIDSTKKDPKDFALWKKQDEQPYWESPWGNGRPGWHIEDTAITEAYFGPQYDIHGGGLDLIFPHHDAEIAQMEASSGKEPLVEYWMHTGFLNVSGEKMSKSLGNFITIKELLEIVTPEVYRFFVLSTHYRSPIDFSEDTLKQAENSLKRIQNTGKIIIDKLTEDNLPEGKVLDEDLELFKEEFFNAMNNDFNTPIALSNLFDFTHKINKAISSNEVSRNTLNNIVETFKDIESILGFDIIVEDDMVSDVSGDLLNIITEIREDLRSKKDWDLADKIRDELANLDITLEDK